jgi:hypothetical protein
MGSGKKQTQDDDFQANLHKEALSEDSKSKSMAMKDKESVRTKIITYNILIEQVTRTAYLGTER